MLYTVILINSIAVPDNTIKSCRMPRLRQLFFSSAWCKILQGVLKILQCLQKIENALQKVALPQ